MKPLTENEIRASFVNTSRREAKQARLPADHESLGQRWEELDVLGWTDRSNPQRAYAVPPTDDEPVGLVLRASERRLPNGMEGGLDPLALVERRVEELRARSSAFARRVRDGS